MKNNGFIEPIVKDTDFIGTLGANLPDEVLCPSADWEEYMPSFEVQSKRSIESFNCTGFGWNNAIEGFMKKKFFSVGDNSDRYTGIMAGTKPPGNDPNIVIESIRTDAGLIPEALMPFDEAFTVDQYYSPNPPPDNLVQIGKNWLKNYYLRHEWIFSKTDADDIKKKALINALKYSPVPLAVNAWNQNGEKYVRLGVDNHWTVCIGYKENDYWKIYDSYAPHIKFLDWNYQFNYAKRFYIGSQDHQAEERQVGILTQIRDICFLVIDKLKQAIFIQKSQQIEKPPITAETLKDLKPIDLPNSSSDSPPLITEWAKAIEKFEGYYEGSRSYRNCNPGNLKYTLFGRDVLAMIGKDDKGFGIFSTYDAGFRALCKFLIMAKEDKLRSYRPDMTLYDFFSTYAPSNDDNDPLNYAKIIAKKLDVPVNYKIKDIV